MSAFLVLKQGQQPSEELRKELLQTVRRELGALVVVGDLNFVEMLPKTRSGKIMRRVLKAVVSGRDPGDVSTIEDEGSVEEAREAWRQMSAQVAEHSLSNTSEKDAATPADGGRTFFRSSSAMRVRALWAAVE